MLNVIFLNNFIDHENIPDDHCKAVSCMLLALHLKPLTDIYATKMSTIGLNSQRPDVILEVLHVIMNNITYGLKFKNYCAIIGREFCNAIENHPNIFINTATGTNHLQKYKDLLQTDNLKLLKIAIKSMKKLTSNVIFKEIMEIFFFTPDDEGQTVINMLEHLLSTRVQSLKLKIISLIVTIKEHYSNQEILTPETRISLYSSVINTSNIQMTSKIFQMVSTFDGNNSLVLMKVFKELKIAKSAMMSMYIKFVIGRKISLASIVEIVISNVLTDQETAAMACQLFESVIYNIDSPDQFIVLKNFSTILEKCISNENIFYSMLQFLICFDISKMKQILSAFFDITSTLILTLLNSFDTIQSTFVLKEIMKCLTKIFYCISTNIGLDVLQLLSKKFLGLYDQLLQSEAFMILGSESSSTMSHASVLMKMDILLETGFIGLTYFQYDAITVINMKHLENPSEVYFSLFARFQTTVLRSMWDHLVGELNDSESIDIPFGFKFVSCSVSSLTEKLIAFMTRRDLNLYQARNCFISLMELLFYFYKPTSLIKNKKGKSFIFGVSQPKVTKQQMREIVAFAEYYVFIWNENKYMNGIEISEEMNHHISFQQDMLLSIADLVKNNRTLPNITSLFKLVRHYRSSGKFQHELDLLLTFTIANETIFQQIIGYAVFSFAKHGVAVQDFEFFMIALSQFFCRIYPGSNDKISTVLWKVCKFLLRNLNSFVKLFSNVDEDEDRLVILDYIQIFAHGMNISKDLLKL